MGYNILVQRKCVVCGSIFKGSTGSKYCSKHKPKYHRTYRDIPFGKRWADKKLGDLIGSAKNEDEI